QIRLLHIYPGRFDETVNIQLQCAELSSRLRYDALSYAWGTQTSPFQARVNVVGMWITANLDCALRYLRQGTRTRALWVDVLCINQKDTIERNSQVKAMEKVYKLADQVIIWLGPEDGVSEHEFHADWNGWEPDLFHAKIRIFSRPWFSRLWVAQEFVLARDPVV
ncbi:hypothetical protein BU23DRAFT_363585, partial [Bimuria novae-zelandiae CBS 107.79]